MEQLLIRGDNFEGLLVGGIFRLTNHCTVGIDTTDNQLILIHAHSPDSHRHAFLVCLHIFLHRHASIHLLTFICLRIHLIDTRYGIHGAAEI